MNSIIEIDHLWDDVHTSYFSDNTRSAISLDSKYVHNSHFNKAPNGKLLKNNTFIKSLRLKPEKVYLLHVTKELDKIKESMALYPSAGCLIGCIYTTQLTTDGENGFKMHNLGKHILQKEASLCGNKPTALIIEATYNGLGKSQSICSIDYLKFGAIHHTIYQNLRYLLTPQERFELENIVSEKISSSLDFLYICWQIENNQSIISSIDFIEILNQHISILSILGYVYFEVIAQYTMLYSRDSRTKSLRKIGEFNNEIYKKFLLDIYDKIGHFKLSDFSIDFRSLELKLQSLEVSGELVIERDDFYDYIRRQVSHIVVETFMTDQYCMPNFSETTKNYDGFSKYMSPLVGHIIHRELRNFNRYKDFYFYFDQFKALSVWNYWNKNNIALPFNGPIQKGEIGINPAYSHVKYRIFTAVSSPFSSDHLVVDKELFGIEIAPRLIDLRHTSMRSRDYIVSAVMKKE